MVEMIPLPQGGDHADQQPVFAKLHSSATLPSERVGGSAASTLEWLPRPPHDLLLVGHWDGTTALWRLAPAATARRERYHVLVPPSTSCHLKCSDAWSSSTSQDPAKANEWQH